jgi:uncharacterized protein YjbI with pentapeptide repeats
VEFTNARALRLVPTIRPDGNESWYFAEAADVASNETAHSQTEASVHPNGDAVLSPPKTATPESSPSADRESRPVSKHLEVLQRGIEDWNFARKSKPGVKPNLQGCDLREVFAKADRFVSVQLAGADMRGANLAGLKFHQPLLCDVNLAGADLTGAIWQKAKAPIYSLDIMARYGMDLRAANLEGANLSRTTFEEPCLVGTNFRGAKLVDADFSGSMLNGICFDGADLQNAKLRGANLTNASFEGANLRGADLSTATVTKQQVAQASTDCDTKLPVDWEF